MNIRDPATGAALILRPAASLAARGNRPPTRAVSAARGMLGGAS